MGTDFIDCENVLGPPHEEPQEIAPFYGSGVVRQPHGVANGVFCQRLMGNGALSMRASKAGIDGVSGKDFLSLFRSPLIWRPL